MYVYEFVVCVHVYVYVCMCMCVCACVHVCVCVCVCVCVSSQVARVVHHAHLAGRNGTEQQKVSVYLPQILPLKFIAIVVLRGDYYSWKRLLHKVDPPGLVRYLCVI